MTVRSSIVSRDKNRPLRAGDWVEVRSRAEILGTLTGGKLDGLPLMPQQLEYCGQRFMVYKRAHKTCDTVNNTGGRKMDATVHLEALRCNGEAYGGCGAACLMFWKQKWLTKVSGPNPVGTSEVEVVVGRADDASAVWRATLSADSTDEDPTYSCQATNLPAATQPLVWWEVRQYIED